MTTLERLEMDYSEVNEKLRRNEKLSNEELKILEIYMRLQGGKAGNAGKRKSAKNTQKVN